MYLRICTCSEMQCDEIIVEAQRRLGRTMVYRYGYRLFQR